MMEEPGPHLGPTGDAVERPVARRGPAQLHLTVGSTRLDPGGVTSMVIDIKPDGEVSGFVGQGGFKLAGLASLSIAPYIAQLDVTASNCVDSRFNGRYQGQLGAIASSKEARLSLSTLVLGILGSRPQFMTIEAVLKR